jgi:hypothetical protein
MLHGRFGSASPRDRGPIANGGANQGQFWAFPDDHLKEGILSVDDTARVAAAYDHELATVGLDEVDHVAVVTGGFLTELDACPGTEPIEFGVACSLADEQLDRIAFAVGTLRQNRPLRFVASGYYGAECVGGVSFGFGGFGSKDDGDIVGRESQRAIV